MKDFYVISESNNKPLTKTEIKKIVKTEIERALNKAKILDKENVREIVKDMMIKQYKFFWEKKSFWVNNI
jgi:chemotaxis methyl-accepting protein methylase